MELQPIVGSECAHCRVRILVDFDAKNCKRCGLAVHKRCGKAHRESSCARKPAVASVAHDYDELPPLEWTPRLIAILAVATFVLATGLAMGVRVATWSPDASAGAAASPPQQAPSRARGVAGWTLALVGAAGLFAGYQWERGQQARAKRR